MSLEVKVYQKENRLRFATLLRESLSDIFKSRFLSTQLAVRDIKAQYRQSYFGILWAFAPPLMTALVWILLNKSGAVTLTNTGMPYPVYAFTGTLIWSIIVESINNPINSTNGARSILTKINFPKEALIISGLFKLLFNSGIKLILLLFFVLAYGVGLQWSLLWFPFAILGAVLVGTTIGLFITPFGLLYKDVGKFISFGLRFLMYATPVVYVVPKEGLLKSIMLGNPLTPIILIARNTVTGSAPEFLGYFLIIIACCIPLLFVGLVFYRVSIPVIVERFSA
ncbi:ABC transporter permease [Aestuariivivens insulae]|uniref:ABC transporter permease n=1 Tax=Aestuariivivens insulae TaxID=1621988 RepID=UPI001F57CD10|nr:ABC transporter permease [Aestuariivivens insulae]